MKRYLAYIGTRPEAIKMCPLIHELKAFEDVQVRVVLTGQHRDMVAPVLRFFGVRPHADLGVMREGQSVLGLTQRLLEAIPRDLADSDFVPDAVLVHGDTTTAFVGALCAFYAGIPVVHIEAGLRTCDVRAPFPEEFNRRAIDAVSGLHFAPTAAARDRLVAEGHAPDRVFTVGNTATDALRLCLSAPSVHPLLDWAAGRRLILLSAHRREMSEEQRRDVLCAIRREIEGREDVCLIFPVHPSPVVRRAAEDAFAGCANAYLTEPLDLPLLQQLMARATLLLTDSGGMQEEATYLGLPTLVLREVTERPEGVAAGVLRLVGTEPAVIQRAMANLLDDEKKLSSMASPSAVYGDGFVSRRIAAILEALSSAGAL
jgi:UDP-N-acetylglucosamine 2-epimerase (non-hydrolysing)